MLLQETLLILIFFITAFTLWWDTGKRNSTAKDNEDTPRLNHERAETLRSALFGIAFFSGGGTLAAFGVSV